MVVWGQPGKNRIPIQKINKKPKGWAHGSSGRVLPEQGGGPGFNPHYLK
jgi:hypothetical protein